MPKAAESLKAIISEPFRGHDRALAKETVAKGAPQGYRDLKALLKALPSDQVMLKLKPYLTVRSARIKEEDKNFTVANCWIYTVRHEANNDFSIILGSSLNANGSEFIFAGVCGIPKTGPWVPTLEEVRRTFVNLLGFNAIQRSYQRTEAVNPPLRVQIAGSLYYGESGHAPGAIGPRGMRPRTNWAIHPITAL